MTANPNSRYESLLADPGDGNWIACNRDEGYVGVVADVSGTGTRSVRLPLAAGLLLDIKLVKIPVAGASVAIKAYDDSTYSTLSSINDSLQLESIVSTSTETGYVWQVVTGGATASSISSSLDTFFESTEWRALDNCGWRDVISSKWTATPASTSQLTMSDTSDFSVGCGMRWSTDNGATWNYAKVTTVTTNTSIDIAGPDLAGTITDVYRGCDKIRNLVLVVRGTYADADNTDLLESDASQFVPWMCEPGYVVQYRATHKTADTGTEPRVNVMVNGNKVGTENANAGIDMPATGGSWVTSSANGINASNYKIEDGQEFNVAVDNIGGNGDASDLSVALAIVLE